MKKEKRQKIQRVKELYGRFVSAIEHIERAVELLADEPEADLLLGVMDRLERHAEEVWREILRDSH
jgi:hypothetical protein